MAQNDERYEACIIGGGISGLALGYFLKEKGIHAPVLEKNERPGGWIRTTTDSGFLFEKGPRSLRHDPLTLELIAKLGIENEIVKADPAAKKRYIYTEQKLRRVPHGFAGMILKGIWRDLRQTPKQQSDESIHDFFKRRFGTAIAETLADAMVSGIFAGDSHALSMRSCFPSIHELEQNYGSVIQGMFRKKSEAKGSIYTFRNGLETLVQALAAQIDLRCSSQVIALTPDEEGISIHLENEKQIHAKRLFLALPSASVHQLFPQIEPIPSCSIATVNLGYRKNLLFKKGFGYLIPSKEKEDVLGVVFDSSAFPEQNRHTEETRLTVMLGGARNPAIAAQSLNTLETAALKAVRDHLAIQTEPDAIEIEVAEKAIPQYLINHAGRLQIIEKQINAISPCLTLLGNSFYGVGVNDCIRRADLTAKQVQNDPDKITVSSAAPLQYAR